MERSTNRALGIFSESRFAGTALSRRLQVGLTSSQEKFDLSVKVNEASVQVGQMAISYGVNLANNNDYVVAPLLSGGCLSPR